MNEKTQVLSHTEKKVLFVLDDYQPHDRSWICKQTNIPRTTVYDILQRLKSKQLIEYWSKPNGRGRPKTMFCKKLLFSEDEK